MTKQVSHVLLDIEGTTCPVSFVSETLFPYAIRELEAYLERHGHEENIQLLTKEVFLLWRQDNDENAQKLLKQAIADMQLPPNWDDDSRDAQVGQRYQLVVPYLLWLIQQDRKSTPLKELQGLIWQEGYSRGELKSTLFEEVPKVLEQWHKQGLILGVYSSGSIAAQKLLYCHSQAGDLTPLFKHWFDTRIGPKHESKSYKEICEAMRVAPERVIFISDSEAELKAASAANLQVVLSDRDLTQEKIDNVANLRKCVSKLTQVELPK